MKLWDAIVVGAGPAGCAAAYDLARAGRKVLLLDRAEFPRQKACAGGLTNKTIRALRYDISPVVRQRLKHLRIERDRDRSLVLRRRADYCYMTVRKELDDFCLRQTIAAGAHFRRIRAISAIGEDAAGVEILADGEPFRAHYLIGADGVHSQVRQLTHGGRPSTAGNTSDWFWRGFALEANVKLPDAAREDLVFDFATIRDGYGWIFPKGDHVNIGLYSYAADEKIDRGRLAAYIRARYGELPADDVIGQYAGFGAAEHRIAATRIFLVGDAGGFVDPLTGEGIYFAIVSGQAAAKAVRDAIHNGSPAHLAFQRGTQALRADLALSTSGARWFYSNLDKGYSLLSKRLLQGLALRAFAEGLNLSRLAFAARKLTKGEDHKERPRSLLN
jgi:geranylgeranyl reductase family protein